MQSLDIWNILIDRVLERIEKTTERLDNKDEWLFVVINTMKAIIDNSCKEEIHLVRNAAYCQTTSELQAMYDAIQGKYGRDGFSYRNNPKYYYLSSLVARYPQEELTDEDRENISRYCEAEEYLLYRI